ncbi:TRAP transporter substrate-binding protein [Chloroflexota bacterium]
MRKLFILLTPLLVISLMLGMVACGGDEATPTPKPTTAPTAAPTPTPEPIVLKAAMDEPATTVRGQAMLKFKELVEQDTGGRVTVDLYAGGVLFPSSAEWQALISGAIDVNFAAPYFASTAIPEMWLWYQSGGLWEGADHGWAVISDARIYDIFDDLATAEGAKLLGFLANSTTTALVLKDEEVKDFTDLQGLRIGATGKLHPLWSEYSGLVSVSVGALEHYVALAQGIIDCVLVAVDEAVSKDYHEVANYAFLYPPGFAGTVTWMNEDTWDGLPSDIQDIILNTVMPKVQRYAQDTMLATELVKIEELEANTTAVHYATPAQLAAAAEALKDDPQIVEDLSRIGTEIIDIVDELRPSRQ